MADAEVDATLPTTAKVAGGTARVGLVAGDGVADSVVVTTAVTTTNVEVGAAAEEEVAVPGLIDSSVRLPRSGRIWMRSWTRTCPTPAGF